MSLVTFRINTIKNQIEATKRLIASGLKQYILRLIDLEARLEERIKLQQIELSNKAESAKFIKLSNDQEYILSSYDFHTLTGEILKKVCIKNLPNGFYRVESIGDIRYILIKNQGITQRNMWSEIDCNEYERKHGIQDPGWAQKKKDLARSKRDRSQMPKLEGSPKQIAWANSIRWNIIAKYDDKGLRCPEYIWLETSAKYYIDKRNVL